MAAILITFAIVVLGLLQVGVLHLKYGMEEEVNE